MDSPFAFSKTIKPIPLNDVDANLEGKKIKLSGWGKTENEDSPARLRETSLKVTENMDIESMKKSFGFNPIFRFIMGGDIKDAFHGLRMSLDQGSSFCQGDSGGIIYRNKMIYNLNHFAFIITHLFL